MPVVTLNGKKRPAVDPKKPRPPPGLVKRFNNARRRFKRRQSEECSEPVVASLDPSSSTPVPPVPDISLIGATTSEEVSSSAPAPAKNSKTIQSRAWLPPLFAFSVWRARLRRFKSESRRSFTSPDAPDALRSDSSANVHLVENQAVHLSPSSQ
ncbi:hypothetical protein ACEPAI_2603 [Sanghuangporus weigelae]